VWISQLENSRNNSHLKNIQKTRKLSITKTTTKLKHIITTNV